MNEYFGSSLTKFVLEWSFYFLQITNFLIGNEFIVNIFLVTQIINNNSKNGINNQVFIHFIYLLHPTHQLFIYPSNSSISTLLTINLTNLFTLLYYLCLVDDLFIVSPWCKTSILSLFGIKLVYYFCLV